MGCPEKDCCTPASSNTTIFFPHTFDHNTPWKFYNHLIRDIPEDILVTDYCLGTNWSYVDTDQGMGLAFTCKGGAKRTHTMDFRGLPLKEVAELSKSWCFEEASLGVAALNAWYSQHDKLDVLGATYDKTIDLPDGTIRNMDAFELYRSRMQGAKVAVIGHFPHVERIAEYADLTILERNCSQKNDTPDPACEYVLSAQDFIFITGVTIINKTAPRLFDLAKNATTIFVGPSVVPSPFLFDWGAETLAGSVVSDKEKTKHGVLSGTGKLFGEAIQMASITRPDS